MATYKQLTLMCYTKLEDHWFDYSALQQTIEISTICPTNWHCIDRKIGLQLQIESKLKCMVPPHTLKFKQFAFINFISSNKQILPTNFSGFLSKGHSQFVDVPLMYYTIKAIYTSGGGTKNFSEARPRVIEGHFKGKLLLR